MKTIILVSLLAFAEYTSQAQTLSKNDLTPVIGEQFEVYIYNNQPKLFLEHAGKDQTWDLSRITRSVQVNKIYQVVHPDSTPYNKPLATFAFKYFTANDTTSIGYKYYKDTVNGFYALADILPYRDNEYLNPEFIYKFPLNLNDALADSSCYSTTLSSFYDELCGMSTLKFDGTGTLKLPFGTYTDVYRLAYFNYYIRESFSDTIYTKSWYWYKKGTHFPIAEYVKFTMDGVDYITIYLLKPAVNNGVKSMEQPMNLKVYPNPTNGLLTIQCEEKCLQGFTIHIYDANGKQIKSQQIDANATEINLDLHELTSGCYYYSISNDGELGRRGQLIVE